MSSDNGSNWYPINNDLPQNISIYCLAISGNNIFAGAYKDIGSGGVFITHLTMAKTGMLKIKISLIL